MTRLAALALAILGAVVAAVPFILWRRLKGFVPEYATWADYRADAEGDALEPDPYLSTLTDAGDGRAEVRRG